MCIVYRCLFAQLKDCQSNGDNKGEERQLEGVESLQTEDAECQWNEGDGLQQNEHHNGDDDFLQFRFAG